jgi:hypothetical protein
MPNTIEKGELEAGMDFDPHTGASKIVIDYRKRVFPIPCKTAPYVLFNKNENSLGTLAELLKIKDRESSTRVNVALNSVRRAGVWVFDCFPDPTRILNRSVTFAMGQSYLNPLESVRNMIVNPALEGPRELEQNV